MYLFSPVRFARADAVFARQLVDWCQRSWRTTQHIVRKAPGTKGFAVSRADGWWGGPWRAVHVAEAGGVGVRTRRATYRV